MGDSPSFEPQLDFTHVAPAPAAGLLGDIAAADLLPGLLEGSPDDLDIQPEFFEGYYKMFPPDLYKKLQALGKVSGSCLPAPAHTSMAGYGSDRCSLALAEHPRCLHAVIWHIIQACNCVLGQTCRRQSLLAGLHGTFHWSRLDRAVLLSLSGR
jgi:hypothetical protein